MASDSFLRDPEQGNNDNYPLWIAHYGKRSRTRDGLGGKSLDKAVVKGIPGLVDVT